MISPPSPASADLATSSFTGCHFLGKFPALLAATLVLVLGLADIRAAVVEVTHGGDSGIGSLRDAINQAEANHNAGIPDTEIRLHALQAATMHGQAVVELQSELSIPVPLQITADPELPRPILRSKDNNHRILLLRGEVDGRIHLSHLQFSDGAHGMGFSRGGAIAYVQTSANDPVLELHIDGCHFIGNRAGDSGNPDVAVGTGGAIYFRGINPDPDFHSVLRIENSLFLSNRVETSSEGFSACHGSAISLVRAVGLISNTHFEDNTGDATLNAPGGTISLQTARAGTEIADCVFIHNRNGQGASGIVVTYHSTGGAPGSIAQIRRCLFFENGGPDANAAMVVGGNTSGNTDLTVVNCIFLDNQGRTASAIVVENYADVRVRHCTIYRNRQSGVDVSGYAIVHRMSNSSLEIDRTIIAGNYQADLPDQPSADLWIFGTMTDFESGGYNFIGNAEGIIHRLAPTDIFGTSHEERLVAPLGELMMYGTDRFFLPPIPGSILVDAIPLEEFSTRPTGNRPGVYNPRFDFRGVERRTNGRAADIGAVELERVGYEDWATEWGLKTSDDRNPSTDLSGDGIPNRMAYLLGLDPRAWHSNPLQRVTGEHGTEIVFVRNGLAYSDPGGDALRSWRVEKSTDLESWEPMANPPRLIPTPFDSLERVIYRIDVDESGKDRAFYRLRAE